MIDTQTVYTVMVLAFAVAGCAYLVVDYIRFQRRMEAWRVQDRRFRALIDRWQTQNGRASDGED